MRICLRRRAANLVTLVCFCLGSALLLGCDPDQELTLFEEDDYRADALELIEERGALRVITGHSPVSYFIYRGVPMGYEYEVLMQLAYEMEVDLELVVERDVDAMFELLQEGAGDLIAYRLPIAKYHEEPALFTDPLHHTRQVLVQRVGNGAPEEGFTEEVIERAQELAGDTLHVLDQRHFRERALNLGQELGVEIDVIRISPDVGSSEVARRVSAGQIDYTILTEELASLEAFVYENVHARPLLSVRQRIGWALRNDSPEFLNHLNSWLDEFQETNHHQEIYQRYFEDRLGYTSRMRSPFISLHTGQISEYDDLIRRKVEQNDELNWDWRLVAALIQQESRFNTYARSWAGAMGLMQLMGPTAREFGVRNVYDPEENIRGGLRFLVWLNNYWEQHIPDPEERRRFVLASYNTGHGHVQDARRLTEYFDGDPNVWEDVAYYLLRKGIREYYEHEVVRFGYSRGSEPVAYVRTILNSYEHYRSLLDDPPAEEVPAAGP